MVARGMGLLSLIAVLAAAGALALTLGSAGASPLTITLGSTTGTPTQNICGADCTYVPFTDATTPTLQVPFDGTITSFSVNSGSAGNIVELRVLQPAAGGQFIGVSSSPAETLSTGVVSTFSGLSIPVAAGDVIGLDNGSSAIIFDTTDPTQHTAYYSPALANGQTAAPNSTQPGYRLLLSATMQEAATASTTATVTSTTTVTNTTTLPSTTTVTSTVTSSSTTPVSTPPAITSPGESASRWRERRKASSKQSPPYGTTFTFRLSEAAAVTWSFSQQTGGRIVGGICVAQRSRNGRSPACARAVSAGSLTLNERAGTVRVFFHGGLANRHTLKPGSYTVLITATNSAHQVSNTASLSLTATAS